MPPSSAPDCLLQDRTNDNFVALTLRSLLAAQGAPRSFPGSYPSLLHRVYQDVIARVGDGLGTQLRTEFDMMIEKAVRQQLDVVPATVLKSKGQASLDVA